MLVGVFASIFGLWGVLPVLLAASTFTAAQYIASSLTTEVIVIMAFSTILPLVASFIIWHNKSGKDENSSDNRAFRNLANELSEVASKSEVVINAIGDGVVAIDSQGTLQLINPAAQRIIGWGKQDALALNYKSVLQLVDQENNTLDTATDPIQQALNTNQQIRTNDLTLMTKSSKKIMISLVVSPVGEVGSGVIVVFRDVTKEKAEEREQAEFISTASHEMRTPVASIEGYLGLALNPNTAQIDEKARDFIMKAHESAQHLGRLFQDLLDVSKSEDGRLSNIPKVIDITTFAGTVVQGLLPKATEKGLQLTYVPMPLDSGEKRIAPVYLVNLDNDHIREVINNLVENAIKYTPQGQVIVDVSGDDDHVVISVKDSGIGIPAEDIPHLFQKFYRVDNKDTRDIGGTGLGLYLSRRLAETMGGRMWVESVYTKGSTFFVELPRISSQDANQLKEQEALRAQQEANRAPTAPVSPAPIVAPAEQPPAPTTVAPATSVPRGEALTPDQIAAYVAKQRELVQQQPQPAPAASAQPARPQTVAVPTREPEQ